MPAISDGHELKIIDLIITRYEEVVVELVRDGMSVNEACKNTLRLAKQSIVEWETELNLPRQFRGSNVD